MGVRAGAVFRVSGKPLAFSLGRIVHAVFLIIKILIDADEMERATFPSGLCPCVRQRRSVTLAQLRVPPRRPQLTVIVDERNKIIFDRNPTPIPGIGERLLDAWILDPARAVSNAGWEDHDLVLALATCARRAGAKS